MPERTDAETNSKLPLGLRCLSHGNALGPGSISFMYWEGNCVVAEESPSPEPDMAAWGHVDGTGVFFACVNCNADRLCG